LKFIAQYLPRFIEVPATVTLAEIELGSDLGVVVALDGEEPENFLARFG
jgi:hypothetical protein